MDLLTRTESTIFFTFKSKIEKIGLIKPSSLPLGAKPLEDRGEASSIIHNTSSRIFACCGRFRTLKKSHYLFIHFSLSLTWKYFENLTKIDL